MNSIDPSEKLREFSKLPISKEKVTIKLSILEAAMVARIRELDFGEVVVYKQKGEPRRVVVKGSEMLSEAEGLKLAALDLVDDKDDK